MHALIFVFKYFNQGR